MKYSDSFVNLAKALVAFQQSVEPIVKDRENPHFKRNYATFDAIMESVRPILASHGLAVIQGGTGPVSDVNGHICGVSVETLLVHVSGEYVSSLFTLPLDKPSAQAVGSAVTYGRRYGVSALLALTTEEDDDGHVATANSLNAAPPLRRAATQALHANAAKADEAKSCPKCGGATWDNRLTKKNPKQPDYKCKDKGCEGVIWPPQPYANTLALAGTEDFDDFPPFDDSDYTG